MVIMYVTVLISLVRANNCVQPGLALKLNYPHLLGGNFKCFACQTNDDNLSNYGVKNQFLVTTRVNI